MSKTFDFDADNTSDHQPIILKLDYKTQLSNDQPVVIPVRKKNSLVKIQSGGNKYHSC